MTCPSLLEVGLSVAEDFSVCYSQPVPIMNENGDKGKKSQSDDADLPNINFMYKTMCMLYIHSFVFFQYLDVLTEICDFQLISGS